MQEIDIFRKIAENPNDYARKWKKETGGKVAGFFCSYTPEEIITAADSLGFRILGNSAAVSLANAHIQSYACSFVRSSLEEALSGELDFLDGAVFPHTCDSIQRLSDIWRINLNLDFHTDIILPVKLNTESAKKYAVNIFKKFKSDIEKSFNIKISDEKIRKVALLYNKIRESLKKIYNYRIEKPNVLTSADIYSIFKASMVMERSIFLEKLLNLIKAIEQKEALKEDKKRIIISGGICGMTDIYTIIEDAGGVIVSDDLCTGLRYCDGVIDLNGDIIENIAERYIERIICPAKHNGLYKRGENLIKTVKETKASGVIFIFLKFCEPHAFDYPYIKEMLKKEKISSLSFEIEGGSISLNQLKTRCEAFIETLS